MLFACIFVPDFAAEALVRGEPDLRDAAVAVLEGKPPLLTVVAANERARQAGVECGMTNMQASARLNRCATAKNPSVMRRRSLSQEIAAHAALADCACAFSPRMEECAGTPDTVLLDLKGLDRLFGVPQKIARELAHRAGELGLEANVAVSANLDAAICAARGFGGITVIPTGKETERLAPLPINVLLQVAAAHNTIAPANVARQSRKTPLKEGAHKNTTTERVAEILDTLDRWGIRTFRALAALPEIAVAERLGSEGVYLQRLCCGQGTRALIPTDSPLTFEETIELEYPIDDLEPLAFVLSRLLEQLCARLSARALSTNELHLRLELNGCHDYDITGSTNDQALMCALESAIYERTLRLPVPMLDARIFLRLWQLELRSKPPAAAVTRVWLRAEPVQPRNTQGGLFLPTAPEPERLELTLARIAAVICDKKDAAPPGDTSRKHSCMPFMPGAPFDPGSRLVRSTHTVAQAPLNEMSAVEDRTSGASPFSEENTIPRSFGDPVVHSCNPLRVGSPEILDTHRSDAFRMKRFLPTSAPAGPAPSCRSSALENEENQTVHRITALRLFRPQLPAKMDMIDGRPAWVDAARHPNAGPISGEITWCSGPWRTSGEWWNDSWSREEWDVAVEDDNGRIVCRVYRDEQRGSWFVEGIYD